MLYVYIFSMSLSWHEKNKESERIWIWFYQTREPWHLYPHAFYHFLTIRGRPWYEQNLKNIYTKNTQSRHGNMFNEKCLFVCLLWAMFSYQIPALPFTKLLKNTLHRRYRYHSWQTKKHCRYIAKNFLEFLSQIGERLLRKATMTIFSP